MESSSGERRFDRRTALAGFSALVGAYVLGLPGIASAANRVPVWRLDAVHSAGPGAYSAGCVGCSACRNHALNRVFATKAAAAEGRAHTNCRCRLVRSSLSEADFVAIFGAVDKPKRTTYDRRWDNAGGLKSLDSRATAKEPRSLIAAKRSKVSPKKKKQLKKTTIAKHVKKVN